jgi:hypothetical protein
MIDIIPKELPKLPKWVNALFYVLLVLFVSSIIIFFVLRSSISKAVVSLEDLNSELLSKNLPETIDLEKEILAYRAQFQDFEIILGEHKYNTKSFAFLEEIVHPFVWFSSFELQPQEEKVSLKGEAKDFNSLGQQLLILKNRNDLNDFKLVSAVINKDAQIDFDLIIYFKPGYLNAKD